MKLIIYELNEVPYRVLNEFCRVHPKSTIAHLLTFGNKFETVSEDEGVLSPWITWPTLHRGVTNKKHLISDFGQDLSDVNAEHPNSMDLLATNGIKVGVFGSLHTYPLPRNIRNYSFYIPDTFAQGVECHPKSIEVFQDFNLKMMDRSGRNVSAGIAKQEAFTLLRQFPRLGITPNTFGKLGTQLISEIRKPERKVRRRTSQTQLAFDVFFKNLKKHKPDCSTFFTNHVASSMHRYWPCMFPEDYKSTHFDSDWLHRFKDEIDYTMKVVNLQLSKLKQFAESSKDYKLVVLSSMGQAAVDGAEIMIKQLQITNKQKFIEFFKVKQEEWTTKRAMAPRYVFQISNEPSFIRMIDLLKKVKINGEALDLKIHSNGVFVVKLGQANLIDNEIHISIDGKSVAPTELGIENIEIQDATGSYAYHIPNGCFIVYDPNKSTRTVRADSSNSNVISTTEIAPSILSYFSVDAPGYMERGSSHILS